MANIQDLTYSVSYELNDDVFAKAVQNENKLDEGFKTASMSAAKIDDNLLKAASSASNTGKNASKIDDGLKKASSGAKTLSDHMKDIGSYSEKSNSMMGNLKNALIGLGAGFGIVSAAKAGTESFIEFDQTMANVRATMGVISDKDYKDLQNAALEWGSKTEYSAKQVAEAMFYTASAGFDAKTQTQVLPSILNLASAGQIDLAKSSDILTTSMGSLHLGVKDVPTLVDQMAVAAQASLTDINHMGDAITNVGGSAKNANMSTADLNTELAILANSGKKGADGGVALRNILLDLTGPNDQVSKLMKELGVHVTDTSGKIRPFNDILVDLKNSMKGLNQGTQMGVLEKIGGKENIEALNILLAGSGDQFEKYKNQILNSNGAADKMAKTQRDTLSGSFKLLKNTIDATFIKNVNNSELGTSLKDLMKSLTSMVPKAANEINYLIKLIKDNKSIIMGVIGALAGFSIIFKVVGWIGTFSKALDTFKSGEKAVNGIGKAMELFKNPVFIVVLAIGALIGTFIYAYNSSAKFRNIIGEVGHFLKIILPIVVGVTSAIGVFTVITKSAAIAQGILSTALTIGSTVTKIASVSTSALGGALKATWAVMAANPIILVVSIIAGLVAAFITLYNTNTKFRDGVKEIWTDIANFFKAIGKDIISVINVIIGGLDKIKIPSWVPGIGGKGINIPTVAYAAGTDFAFGGAALVGEYGPEIVNLPRGSKVTTANETSSILNQSQRNSQPFRKNYNASFKPTTNFNIKVYESKAPKDTGNEVVKAIRKEFGTLFDDQFATLIMQLGLGEVPVNS